MDGHDIKVINHKCLRQKIGVVSQEPVLFNMTDSSESANGSRRRSFWKALNGTCKEANCHTFISQLSHSYDTIVGELGGMHSGGQKQRISIARTLLCKPRCSPLDEATSALSSNSERLVQKALDNSIEKGGRTAITIARRLSTIKNVDVICVIKDGQVLEQGPTLNY